MKRQLTSANFNFAITAALLICCLSNGCSQNHNQQEALISNEHLNDEQDPVVRFEQYADSILKKLNEETKKLQLAQQLSQQMIRQDQKRIAYLQQQMNNPEYMRNSYLARRLKELGAESRHLSVSDPSHTLNRLNPTRQAGRTNIEALNMPALSHVRLHSLNARYSNSKAQSTTQRLEGLLGVEMGYAPSESGTTLQIQGTASESFS